MSYVSSKQEIESKLSELYLKWKDVKEPVRGTSEWFRWKGQKCAIRSLKRKLDKFKTYEDLSEGELIDLFKIDEKEYTEN